MTILAELLRGFNGAHLALFVVPLLVIAGYLSRGDE
jgi:hypothetical protein